MELKSIITKLKTALGKYKYVFIVLLAGIALLLIPEQEQDKNLPISTPEYNQQKLNESSLSKLLESVEGAGSVKVMLSISVGEKKIYQTNQNTSGATENINTRTETVIIADGQRNESGLINQINPPVYLGAIVVCQGGDIPSVKLAITQAVSKITGLGADQICVLKMK